MKDDAMLNEIMLNVKQVPLECQERILDILKGMAFTKKCLTENMGEDNNNESNKESLWTYWERKYTVVLKRLILRENILLILLL